MLRRTVTIAAALSLSLGKVRANRGKSFWSESAGVEDQ